jgi:hypothetical protein
VQRIVSEGLERLNARLPLKARQAALPAQWVALHRGVLRSLVETGHVPTGEQMSALAGAEGVAAAIDRLARDDLVVLDAGSGRLVGAYPMTEAATPHRVEVNGHPVNAMCALDALSVAPMFGVETEIHSRCHRTGTPILLRQDSAGAVVAAEPGQDVRVGIRWQSAGSCAAASLCLEMVFLKDAETAAAWRSEDPGNIDLYDLEQAVAFGRAFFRPLVAA